MVFPWFIHTAFFFGGHFELPSAARMFPVQFSSKIYMAGNIHGEPVSPKKISHKTRGHSRIQLYDIVVSRNSSYDYHMIIITIWLSYDYHMIIIWLSYDYHMIPLNFPVISSKRAIKQKTPFFWRFPFFASRCRVFFEHRVQEVHEASRDRLINARKDGRRNLQHPIIQCLAGEISLRKYRLGFLKFIRLPEVSMDIPFQRYINIFLLIWYMEVLWKDDQLIFSEKKMNLTFQNLNAGTLPFECSSSRLFVTRVAPGWASIPRIGWSDFMGFLYRNPLWGWTYCFFFCIRNQSIDPWLHCWFKSWEIPVNLYMPIEYPI